LKEGGKRRTPNSPIQVSELDYVATCRKKDTILWVSTVKEREKKRGKKGLHSEKRKFLIFIWDICKKRGGKNEINIFHIMKI